VNTKERCPALWQLVSNNWIPTELYGELLFQYLTGKLSEEKFLQRTSEIEAIYDLQREAFLKIKLTTLKKQKGECLTSPICRTQKDE